MEARTKETRKLTLIDLKKLVELWIAHYDKVAESDKRLLPGRAGEGGFEPPTPGPEPDFARYGNLLKFIDSN